MKYILYQMRDEIITPYCMLGSDYIDFDKMIKRNNYNEVWKDECDSCHYDYNMVLEELFKTFNINHPSNYQGRSMSVSDVVLLEEDSGKFLGVWFCDGTGFKELDILNWL